MAKSQNDLTDLLRSHVDEVGSLDIIQETVLQLLQRECECRNGARLAFVSGPVTAHGLQFVPFNLRRLEVYTEFVAEHQPELLVFSAASVFTFRHLEALERNGFQNEDFMEFWARVLRWSNVVHVFFAPDWDKSIGAQAEFEIAQERLLPVSFIVDEPNGVHIIHGRSLIPTAIK